jgi:GPH family glycoside/pentoside/hexuronide:cation symporter
LRLKPTTGRGTALRQQSLSLWQKLSYATGAAIDGVTSNALNLFIMFYATAVCGLPGTLAGIALSIGLVVDAVMDPLIGSLSDGWRSRWGRRLPFMALGVPASAILFVLIFSLPTGLGETALFLVLAGWSVLLRVSISLFNLPYYALGAELTDDYGERSRIVAWRWGMGMLAGLATVLIGFGGFFGGPQGTLARQAYSPFALSCAALMLIGGSISVWSSATLRHRAHAVDPDVASGIRGLATGLAEVARNPTFRILFFASLLLFAGQGVTLTLGLHANTYFWRLTPGEIQTVTVMLLVGLLVGAPFFGVIAPRFEKKPMLIAAMAGMVATEALPAGLRLLGALPLDGAPLGLFLAANSALLGLAITAAAIALISMLADAADEHEHLFGHRREGLYFAGWSFAGKSASGLGALIGGVILDLTGFPSGATALGAHLVVGVRTAARIAFFAGPGAATFSIAGIALLGFYRLDRRRHAEILVELGGRRAASY